jgi:hypothetical protein
MSELNRRRFLSIGAAAAGSSLIGFGAGHLFAFGAGQQGATDVPDVILNPVEVSGAEAIPIIGRLPGARRMYVLSAGQGEFVGVGGHVLTRMARPIDTANVYELLMFTGRQGALLPLHMHRGSHAALVLPPYVLSSNWTAAPGECCAATSPTSRRARRMDGR